MNDKIERIGIPACRLPAPLVRRLRALCDLDTPRMVDVLRSVIESGLPKVEARRKEHIARINGKPNV